MAWFIFLEKHIYVHLDSTVSNEEVEWKTISEYGLIWNFIFACINLSLAAQVLYNECEMQPQILKTKDFSFDRLNIIVVFQKGVERNYS